MLLGTYQLLPTWSVGQVLGQQEGLHVLDLRIHQRDVHLVMDVGAKIVFLTSRSQGFNSFRLFLFQHGDGRRRSWSRGGRRLGDWTNSLLTSWPRRISWNIVVNILDHFLNFVGGTS